MNIYAVVRNKLLGKYEQFSMTNTICSHHHRVD